VPVIVPAALPVALSTLSAAAESLPWPPIVGAHKEVFSFRLSTFYFQINRFLKTKARIAPLAVEVSG
jgi:hypothetical protein